MIPIHSARLRAHRIASAFEKFKTHPRYSAVQVQLHENSLKLGKKFPSPLSRLSADSLECAKVMMHIHAEAYLTMVDDMAFQEAYIGVLDSFAKQAWEQFSGMPLEFATADDFRYFRQAIAHWKAEGYRRLSAAEAPAVTAPPAPARAREPREPNPALLENRDTVNHKIAALALGISGRTLDRWIADGKLTATGPSTRKRFKSKDLLKILNQKHVAE